MKPTRVRRGIESRHSQSTGAAPRIGRVSRIRDADLPTRQGWTSKRGGGLMMSLAMVQARRKIVVTWSVALTLGTALVIGGFMLFWLRGHGWRAVESKEPALAENVRIVSEFASPDETAALNLVRRALANRDPELVASNFHLGTAQRGDVIDFLQDMEARDGRIERMSWIGSMDVEGQLLEGVVVVHKEREHKPVERLAFLTPDERGVWKLDFDAFARTCKPSWGDLLEGRSDQSVVRVFLAEDSYFNGPFHDESRWACYAMGSPDLGELLPDEQGLLRGYCKVSSPQAKALERILAAAGKMCRVTLEIRRMEGAEPRQFEIARVLAEDWVLTADPFDERFN